MSTRPLIRENRGPVAVLTLNRPERRNALSRALLAQIRDAVDELGVDSGVRAVVLTGAGAAFSAGMDLKEAAEMQAASDGEHAMVAVLKEFADLLFAIAFSPPSPLHSAPGRRPVSRQKRDRPKSQRARDVIAAI
jgi:enoyl-CoA hydratase/carnithine racemase